MPAKRVQNMRPDSPGRQGDTKNPRTFDVRGRMQQRFVRGDYLERQAHTRTPGSASTPGATGRGRISWLYRPYTLPERSTGTIRSCEDEPFSDGAPKITLHPCADFCRRARTPCGAQAPGTYCSGFWRDVKRENDQGCPSFFCVHRRARTTPA